MIRRYWQSVGQWLWLVSWPVWYVYFRLTPPRARVLIRSGQDVLLVRSWLGSGGLELPGGGRHPHEPAVRAAVREVREELGVVLRESELSPLCEGAYRQHGITVRYITFETHLAAKPRLYARKFEIAEAAWVPIRDVTPLVAKPDATDSLSVHMAREAKRFEQADAPQASLV